MANYGVAPTFGERAWDEPVLEMHFVDEPPRTFPGDEVSASFLCFLRPERKFSSADELKAQIASDLGCNEIFLHRSRSDADDLPQIP